MFHQMRGISLFYHRRTLLVRRTEYEGSWDSLDGWIRTLVHELQWNPLFKDRSEGTEGSWDSLVRFSDSLALGTSKSKWVGEPD